MNYYGLPNYEPVKRKVFVSFHHNDQVEAEAFIEQWGNRQDVFIPKVLGVSDSDDFIGSTNPEYVMGQIRAKYLGRLDRYDYPNRPMHPQPPLC